MNNNNIILEANNLICESNGCLEKATDEIKLDAGKFGKISLFLCKQCIPKFTTQRGYS
jgi:hypothetical protein